MLVHWAKWRRWVLSDPTLTLEQLFFRRLCLLSGVLAILVVIPVNALQNLSPWVGQVVFAFGLVSLALAWAARRGHYCKRTMVLSLVVCLNLIWFPNGGSEGSIGLYFFTVALFLVLFFEGVFRYAGLAVLVVNILGLHLAELAWPHLLQPFKSPTDRLLDLSTGYLISLLSSALMLWVILAGFKREGKRPSESLQSLQASEAQNRALINAIPDLLFELGLDGRYFDIHALDPALLVAPQRELLGRTVLDMLPPSAAQVVMAALQEAHETGKSTGKIYELQLPHGNFWFELSIAAKTGEPGQPPRFIVLARDITERRLAEEGLRISEEKFTKIFQMSPDAIDLVSTAERVSLAFNLAFTNLFGYLLEDFVGKPVLPAERDLWVNLEDRDRLMASMQEHGEALAFEVPLRRKNGSIFIAEISSSALEIDGKPCHISITRDITERRTLQEELEKSKKLLQKVLDTLPIPVYCKDQEGRYTLCNKAFQEFLGRAESELLGKTSFDVSPPHLAEIYQETDRLLLETGRTMQYETEIEAASGLRNVVITKNVMQSPTDERTGVVGAFLDITELKQAEEDRRRFDERMSEVQKLEALGVLVAGVAHNINNVLMVIMGASSLREGRATETKDLEAYTLIGKACRRGRDMVKSLIQFAQPSISNQVPCELHALTNGLCNLLRSTTQNRIEIVEVFSGKPLWIQADAGSISNAIMNLCLNSLDAMPNGGTLTIRTAIPEQDWVEVVVEDTGEGMTPEILAHVIEPFFTTKEVGKGTGLGLSVTHGVLKAHGGTLQISSTAGHGTTVNLRFPRIPAPVLKQPLEAPMPSLRPLKVLLVDDDEDIRFLVARILKKAGFQINAVAGGEEALESLASGPLPDLIILDQNMPRMNGIQTMEKIRALHLELPILISSGQPDIEEWPCFKQPNVAVISKPFDMEELLAKLAKMPPESETLSSS